jgi:hypothetical protein
VFASWRASLDKLSLAAFLGVLDLHSNFGELSLEIVLAPFTSVLTFLGVNVFFLVVGFSSCSLVFILVASVVASDDVLHLFLASGLASASLDSNAEIFSLIALILACSGVLAFTASEFSRGLFLMTIYSLKTQLNKT